MSFPRYPKYKPSGVEWLGDVPEHWEVKPLGHLCSKIGSGKTPSGGAETYSTEGIVFLRSQNVYDEGLFLDDVVYITEETDEDLRGSRVRSGDILLNITGASLGRTCLVPDGLPQANVNQHVCIIRLKDLETREFVSQSMKSCWLKGQIDTVQSGAAREGLNFAQISKLALTIPPGSEQTQIAAFLDRETAKIDELVAEQRRLMELLKEKRQTVISHAVTQGINPKATMKPSGIEWLGDVPEHWEVVRIKTLCSIISKGTTPSTVGADFILSGIRFLKAENITETGVNELPEFYISEEAHAILSRGALNAGDVLVVIAGATTGKSAVLDSRFLPANTNQAVSYLRPRNPIISPFISKWLGTRLVRNLILVQSVQSAQPNLSMEDLGNIPIPIPPHDEMNELMAFLEIETAKFDTLTAEAQRAIDLLQERRTALISAAVTGQIDVRKS